METQGYVTMDAVEFEEYRSLDAKRGIWKNGCKVRDLHYGGVSLDVEKITEQQYEEYFSDPNELIHSRSQIPFDRLAPAPILSSLCVVSGWVPNTQDSKNHNWVSSPAQDALAVIKSIQTDSLNMKKIEECTVKLGVLYYDDNMLQTYETEATIKKDDNTHSTSYPWECDDTVIGSIDIKVITDEFLAHYFEMSGVKTALLL